jgi:hypothetical protein
MDGFAVGIDFAHGAVPILRIAHLRGGGPFFRYRCGCCAVELFFLAGCRDG